LIEVSVNSQGAAFGMTANAGGSRGKGDGTDVTWTNTHVSAGKRFIFESGGDTVLRGAVASGEQVMGDAGGELDHAQYSASSVAVGGGYSVGGGGMAPDGGKGNTTAGGVGTNQQGQATTGGDKVPGNNVATSGNWSATPPAAMAASGSGSSTTVSGISGGAIRITDDAKQRALTGKGADEVVASVNGDVTTEHDGTNALTPIFDENEIRAGFEIVGALQRETGTFLANRAKASSEAQRELDSERAKPEGERDAERVAQLTQVLEENATWGPGGTGRRVLTALTAAAGGNVTGATSQFVQAAGATYLQTLGAEQIKALSPYLGGEGSAAHTALHAVLGCAGGAASGGECGAGALGASAGVVLNTVLDQASRTEGLDASEKEARANLVASLVAGVAQAVGAESAQAVTAAQVETLFNRQLGDDEKKLAKQLTAKSSGKYSQEQIEDQLRIMGVYINGEHESGAPVTLIGEAPTDAGAKWISGGVTADGKPILTQVTAQADPELQNFILANNHSASPAQAPSIYTYDRPSNNDWGFHLTGPFTRFDRSDAEFVRNRTADTASMVSTTSGRFSAIAAAAAEIPSAYSPGFAAAAFAGTVLSYGASAIEQLVRPNPVGFSVDSTVDLLLYRPAEKFPLWGPVINEAGNAIKRSDWLNQIKGQGDPKK
jgi:Hemagglutinin repeat